MKTLYFSSVLLLSFIFGIYTSTCPADNGSDKCSSCPFAGLGRRACPGQGTSYVAEMIDVLYKSKGQYCILGQNFGIYYIFSCTYDLMRGGRATLTLRANVAYAIEVPSKTGQGEPTIYLISITGCAEIRVVEKGSKKKLTGTPLTDAIIYNAIRASHRPYKAPCNTFVGADLRRFVQFFDYLALYLFLDCSRAISMQYILFNGSRSMVPDKIIKKDGYNIHRVNDSDTDTYVEADYSSIRGFQNCSSRPDKGIPLEVALNAVDFDFTPYRRNPQKVLCALSLQISKFGGSTFDPYFLYYERLILLADPYDLCIVCAVYVDTDIGIAINKKIVQLC